MLLLQDVSQSISTGSASVACIAKNTLCIYIFTCFHYIRLLISPLSLTYAYVYISLLTVFATGLARCNPANIALLTNPVSMTVRKKKYYPIFIIYCLLLSFQTNA